MLLSGGTGLSECTWQVNKPNYWPKACNIPVRYVALFSLQLVVIQPFPLDLFTTTNNNNHRYIYMKAFTYIYDNNINISRKMARWRYVPLHSVHDDSRSSLLRMQTAILARLIKERRRRRRNMDNLIQTTNMWLHFATVPQRSRRTVLMKSRHKVFWVVHRVVCLFLLGQLLAATTFFDFRVTTWEGGSSMRKDAESSS